MHAITDVWRAIRWTALLVLALGGAKVAAQPIPSPEYITYVPPGMVRAVSQTAASVRFHLFGDRADPRYRDANPRNGIDDRRDRLLSTLAQEFAPWMVRNAYGFPTDLRKLVRERDMPLVHDRFDLSRSTPRRLSSDTLWLGRQSASDAADARLLALLRRLGPQATREGRPAAPDADLQEVLYLDPPGGDPKSWAREYGDHGGFHVSPRYVGFAKTYAHPFIAQVGTGADGAPRYEFVLQYWFYYPTNDAGNIHEGDMEHINVSIAPRDRVAQPLDAATVAALLDGTLDPRTLVMRRVDHYFHFWVYPVDFSVPNAYAPRAEWAREVARLPTQHVGQRAVWQLIRDRAWLDSRETVINRHPLVLIGGDGRGLGLLLRTPGALGLSTHGSYPFQGLWKATGPGGTGESVDHPDDAHRRPPAADAPETEQMVRYDNPSRIELLPDWEQLAPLALEDRSVRWAWAWFLLPLRTGYPATVSPFAGVIRRADTGNIAPGPPNYNGGWNRIGNGGDYGVYSANKLSSLSPYDVQDNYNARWGFLNATWPTLRLIPPFDLLARLVVRPAEAVAGRGIPLYVPGDVLPARRAGVGFRMSRFTPPPEFGRLIGFPELLTPLIEFTDSITGTPSRGFGFSPARFDPLTGWGGEIDFYLGGRYTSTNGLTHGTATMHRLLELDNALDLPLTARLNFWEYTGSLRYNLLTRRVQPFVDVGYGLSWYRLENLRLRLADYHMPDTTFGTSRWVRKPGLLHNLIPNTFHLAGGVEVLPSYGFGKANVGLKASGGWYTHDLGLRTRDTTTLFFQNSRVGRWKANLTATVAY